MRLFDCHSHWSTRRGYVFQSKEAQDSQRRIWGTEPQFETEDELAATLRRNNVRAMMDVAFTAFSPTPLEEIQALNDYTFEVQRRHPDVIFGHWLTFDPRIGAAGIKEYERCVAAKAGFIGFGIIGLSIDAGIPVLIHTGLTGIGQGFPGGDGIVLDHGHPRHIDAVAAKFPQLKILAGRPAYPWQDEMIAILLHKSNVHYELHGWSPKTFSPALKKEIGGRLQDRIMFGCDYPVLKYEFMVERWRGLGYSEEVLAKVFYRNAEAYFPGAAIR